MQSLTTRIIEAFETFRMHPTTTDQFQEVGKNILADKIESFLAFGLPVKFSMLGYPMKSPNDRDKVLGKLPDLGEELSFKQFSTFAAAVKTLYPPGIHYSFISDGFIFADIMDTPDGTVEAYLERCKDLASKHSVPVEWFSMLDFYPKRLGMAEIREKIMSDFGITTEELQRRILFDENVNHLYRGMLYFMEGDLAIRDFPSRNQLHKKSKEVAREMMFRNEAYSALIQANFTDHIRLSMHPSNNNGEKFSFQLIPNGKHSPWHSAVLQHKDGSIETVHKKEALENGHQIVDLNNQPYYLQEV